MCGYYCYYAVKHNCVLSCAYLCTLHAACEAVEKLAKMFWNINHVRNSGQEQFPLLFLPFSSVTDHSEPAEHPSSSGISPYTDHNFLHEEVYHAVGDSVFFPGNLTLIHGSLLVLKVVQWCMLTIFQLVLSDASLN